jgi:hypothetical protein
MLSPPAVSTFYQSPRRFLPFIALDFFSAMSAFFMQIEVAENLIVVPALPECGPYLQICQCDRLASFKSF